MKQQSALELQRDQSSNVFFRQGICVPSANGSSQAGSCFNTVYCMVLSGYCVFFLSKQLREGHYDFLHFVDEETKAPKSLIAYNGYRPARPGLKYKELSLAVSLGFPSMKTFLWLLRITLQLFLLTVSLSMRGTETFAGTGYQGKPHRQ